MLSVGDAIMSKTNSLFSPGVCMLERVLMYLIKDLC